MSTRSMGRGSETLWTAAVACLVMSVVGENTIECPAVTSQTCNNTIGNTICAAAATNPQAGSIQSFGYYTYPSCLLQAIALVGETNETYFSSCEYQISQQAFSVNGGYNLAYPNPNPEASMVATVIIFLLYFLVPTSYFILVVVVRKKLYAQFSKDPTLSSSHRLQNSAQSSGIDEDDLLPVYLSFHRLTYTVKLNKGAIKKVKAANGGYAPSTPGWNQKKILQNITGVFRPGTLSAIMGPSGCGKSTLLDVLADRKQGGQTRGKVLINGRLRSKLFKRISGYVMQFDALFPHLTVREVLMYTAELRIPGQDWRAKRMAVKAVIKDLDLHRCADSRIGGNGIPGISGGQARRVTVGIELITRPMILFLDEPTTGLDAFSSLQLVRTLRVLADTGRTVIATIHQPRPQIFDLFNTLLLMKDGRIAYFGPVREIESYFLKIGISLEGGSVADAVVDLTYSKESGPSSAPDENAAKVAALADSYATSKQALRIEKLADAIEALTFSKLPPPVDSLFGSVDPVTGTLISKHPKRFSQTLMMQVFILIRRSYKNISRDSTYFTNVGLQMSQFLFYGLLFLGLRTQTVTEPDAGSVVGATDLNYLFILTQRAFLFQVMNTIMLIEVVVIATAFVEKSIFRREHASGAYSVVSYHVQFIIRFYVDAIWKGLLAAVLCYFFPPMRLSADAFFYFAAMLMVCSTMGSSMAFLMVSLVPDAEGAANIHAQILGTFGLYSGFFLFPNVLPVWMKWLYYMLPFKYSFEGLELNEFTCMTNGEATSLFAIDQTLNRWTNLLVFIMYPPIFHLVAMLGSFAYTRPKSFWVRHCSCCFSAEEVQTTRRSSTSPVENMGTFASSSADGAEHKQIPLNGIQSDAVGVEMTKVDGSQSASAPSAVDGSESVSASAVVDSESVSTPSVVVDSESVSTPSVVVASQDGTSTSEEGPLSSSTEMPLPSTAENDTTETLATTSSNHEETDSPLDSPAETSLVKDLTLS